MHHKLFTPISFDKGGCIPLNTDTPLVSIIIPVYNAASDLATCIESVRRQRYQNIEVLLVNDGSSDASLQICHMYAQRDPRFCVIDKENSGVSATRNLAIEHARGKYLQFVDSDDWLDERYPPARRTRRGNQRRP